MFKQLIIFMTLATSIGYAETSQQLNLPIISDDVVYLPNANRYIYATDKLLNQKLQYRTQAGAILNKLIPLTKQARYIHVYGFSDASLKGPVGIKTSKQQAQLIADYLWSQGVPLEKISVRGMGYQEPRITASHDVRQHYFNRRIEIDLIP